jgi:diaminohydroxyphosphoribosylaminopyrimidine deaminase/5-amino-6-(5-phosphoribosylamino)uracil reductase
VVTTSDAAFMERALFHAERGRGRTSPNPIVGAVVVSSTGVVVGQGAHLGAGGPHAEVLALAEAGERGRGGTLYCTLEPCSHVGRTGPCVERIAAAGIRRVVAATVDLNPRVSGQGFAHLRAHGIEVTEDVAREAADRQHAPFFTWITERRPFVIVKSATSIDGYVGERHGRVRLTGPAANRYFHRQRAEIDAIAVGAGTMLTDDPELTARGAYRFRPLTRVVFDWRGRVPATARLFSTLTAGPVIMVVTAKAVAARSSHFAALADGGISIEVFETRDLGPVLERLAKLEIVTLLVEGGPALQNAFADHAAVDRVQWVVTAARLGSGVPSAVRLGPIGHPGAAATARALGEDLFIEFDVHGTDRSDRTH